MTNQDQWYYLEGDQTIGPVSISLIQALVHQGRLGPDDQICHREGNWQYLDEVPGLLDKGGPPQAGDNIYAPPAGAIRADIGPVKRAHFFLLILLPFAGFGLMFAGGVLWGLFMDQDPDLAMGMLWLGIGFGFAVAMAGVILGLVYLYRTWHLIRDGSPRTSPGKAVGFLFIPFFNLYWYFQAFHGLSEDYNAWLSARNLEEPRMNEGLFQAFCWLNLVGTLTSLVPIIGSIISMVYLVVMYMVLFQICRTLNHFAEQGLPEQQAY